MLSLEAAASKPVMIRLPGYLYEEIMKILGLE